MMKKFLFILCAMLLVLSPLMAKRPKPGAVSLAKTEKEEFRGTWIQTAFQERYMKMNPEQCKNYLKQLVEDLSATGFNAILFQVRPEGDAFYASSIEPWSRFLSGRQGVAPSPEWDPMSYMINLCHQHQMEFHAWINPFRITASKLTVLADNHPIKTHPDWVVKYDDRLYLNPAMPECRSFVRSVVKDIVSRYDVDAIHIDDYFYPYPVKGKEFDDKAAFLAYAPKMNFDVKDPEALGNFRRRCINILMKSLHEDIRAIKPWVRFGVSPFGIYRNASMSYPRGSKTQGTQCYDDLYADVLYWAQNGWIDYVIPQLYWEIDHPVADYKTLVKWWNDNVPSQCNLYIGQSIERSLDDPKDKKPLPDLTKKHAHLSDKLRRAADGMNIKGNCFWYAYQVNENSFNIRTFLKEGIYAKPVLSPAYRHIDAIAPEKVYNLYVGLAKGGLRVSWQYAVTDDMLQRPRYFCVYKFEKGERVDISDASHLIMKTNQTSFVDTDTQKSSKYTYVVTSIDAVGNESVAVKKSFNVKIR